MIWDTIWTISITAVCALVVVAAVFCSRAASIRSTSRNRRPVENDMRYLAIILLFAVSGCMNARVEALEAAAIDRAAAIQDKALAVCDFVYTRGASIGAIMRRFGQDPDQARAYRELFHSNQGLEVIMGGDLEE